MRFLDGFDIVFAFRKRLDVVSHIDDPLESPLLFNASVKVVKLNGTSVDGIAVTQIDGEGSVLSRLQYVGAALLFGIPSLVFSAMVLINLYFSVVAEVASFHLNHVVFIHHAADIRVFIALDDFPSLGFAVVPLLKADRLSVGGFAVLQGQHIIRVLGVPNDVFTLDNRLGE